eukprot:GHRQ01031681.1.p1 GENE.GHRQ01031681.1~~GHRQ01031681.1.p1  ORF type:complete len:316 (+),score=73.59 GHRQ01031681.1:292-1239(+)
MRTGFLRASKVYALCLRSLTVAATYRATLCWKMLWGTRTGCLHVQRRSICEQASPGVVYVQRITQRGLPAARSRCRAAAEPSTAGTSITEPVQLEQADVTGAADLQGQQVAAVAATTARHAGASAPQDISIAISPAAEQEIQRALMAENGFRSTRRTKLVCTIGPSSCSYEVLSELAQSGMNVARLNMTHGNHDWHNMVVARIRQLNKEKGYCIAIMADTEGSEIHTGELKEAIKVEVGTQVYFTIRSPAPPEINGVPVVGANYDSLGEDLEVGDNIIVDGGMCELVVTAKAGPDVLAQSIEQGLLLSKANLTFR